MTGRLTRAVNTLEAALKAREAEIARLRAEHEAAMAELAQANQRMAALEGLLREWTEVQHAQQQDLARRIRVTLAKTRR